MVKVEQTITAAFEDFNFVVQALDKATGEAVNKVIGDQVKPAIKGAQKVIKASQTAGANSPNPIADKGLSLVFGVR